MRPCVKCKECDNPIGYPHLTTLEGIYKKADDYGYWSVFHKGIFIGWFNSKENAEIEYKKKTGGI